MKLDMHYLFVAKYAKWIIIALITLFLLLILVEWVPVILLPFRTNTLSQNNNTTPVIANQDSKTALLQSSLFGVYVPNDLNEDSVQKSMLDVTLVGILLADKVEDSQVIIRSASGEEKTYQLKDSIPGGALVKKITASGVLVERKGVLESLALPKIDLTIEPAPEPLDEESVP